MRLLQAVGVAMVAFASIQAAAPIQSAGHATAAQCASLSTLKLPNTTITSAEVFGAGSGRQGRGSFEEVPSFCRVAATLTPSSDSDIKVEVWLPLANWNGKLQGVGNGGWSGAVNTGALATAVRRGYAAASTDTGRLANPERCSVS